ncbi:MAG TPA: dehydrogenase [Thiolapillus brandeum]|uniref:Dehydrogenase n=1 Tax=Thiolapillus brandeum TaxID=1076588 RepID=A0A831RSF2_9GAMM|nr:dehydrogenase [Thiolapillus brandeum]
MRSRQAETLRLFREHVAEDLELLAALHDREPDAAMLEGLRQLDFPGGLGLHLTSEKGRQAQLLMGQALAALPERPVNQDLDELAADYADIYLNHGIQASPEESVWLDDDHLICQDSMFQVRQWLERYGLQAENWRIRPDDHLVYQLKFIAHLLSQEGEPLEEAARFMDEHLLRWIGEFAQRVVQRCGTPYFAGLALLTDAYVGELRDLIAGITGQPRPLPEEIEERMKDKAVNQQPEEAPQAYVPGMGPTL